MARNDLNTGLPYLAQFGTNLMDTLTKAYMNKLEREQGAKAKEEERAYETTKEQGKQKAELYKEREKGLLGILEKGGTLSLPEQKTESMVFQPGKAGVLPSATGFGVISEIEKSPSRFGSLPSPNMPAKKLGASEGTYASQLRREFSSLPIVKDYNTIKRQMDIMQSAYNRIGETKSNLAIDQALGVTYQKILDPTSVVRESEFARTAEGQGLIDRFTGFVKSVATGGIKLTDANRKELVDMARTIYNGVEGEYKKKEAVYRGIATQTGVPESLIFGEDNTVRETMVDGDGKTWYNIGNDQWTDEKPEGE